MELGYIALWWASLELVGILALPLTMRLFRGLPDGGYAFSKALGLLLAGYGLWLGASFNAIDNRAASIWLVLVVLGAISFYLWRREGRKLRQHLRAELPAIAFYEGLFLFAFLGYCFFRAYDPAIYGTEKPMDFAFLNAILRSRVFPPHDPWLSGYAISYYYFGYLMAALLAKLSGVPAALAYNLALGSTFALAALGATSLVYNLIRARRVGSRREALTFGALGGAMLVLLGNLEGPFEVLHARGVGREAFWRWLDIRGLAQAPQTGGWMPAGHWWWWRASRVIHDVVLGMDVEVIDEFPFFSFLLGDLHPHVMALPFELLVLGLALHLLVREGDEVPFRRPIHILWPLILGALGFLNSWDLPAFGLLMVAAFAMREYTVRGRWDRETLWHILRFAIVLIALSALLYLPFYVGFRARTHGLGLVSVRTRLHQYLVMFGLFIAVAAGFLVTALRGAVRMQRMKDWRQVYTRTSVQLALGVAIVLLAPWIVVRIMALVGLVMVFQPVSGKYPLTAVVLLGLMLVTGVILRERLRALARSRSASHSRRGMSTSYACLLLMGALLLTCGVEFLHIVDAFHSRMNTVFKFYYQAWVLYAIACAYGLHYVLSRWRISPHSPGPLRRMGRYVWLALLAALFAASLIYPLTATYSKANGFQGSPTLDGTKYMEWRYPDDRSAIAWLRENTRGDEVIVEATGPDYSEYARVSTQTGLATLLGWPGHEYQWRESYDEINRRQPVVEAIYTSGDSEEIRALLEEYGVSYLYIGLLEREKYGISTEAEEKYRPFMELAYQQGTVSIYRWR